jgi:hypothetical protein
MIIDQFRDLSDTITDIDDLNLRARAYSMAGFYAPTVEQAQKYFKRSRTFAQKAHHLENIAKIEGRKVQ